MKPRKDSKADLAAVSRLNKYGEEKLRWLAEHPKATADEKRRAFDAILKKFGV